MISVTIAIYGLYPTHNQTKAAKRALKAKKTTPDGGQKLQKTKVAGGGSDGSGRRPVAAVAAKIPGSWSKQRKEPPLAGGDGPNSLKVAEKNQTMELKTLFAQQAEHELLQTMRKFYSCKQEEGKFVSSYILKMKSYIDNLERLGHPVTTGLGMTTSPANNSVFRGFFEKQKLFGPNFIDLYRKLRIVLSIKDKLNYLEQPIPPAPVAPKGQQVVLEIIATHTAWIKGSKEINGLMLITMKPEIQRNLENLHAHEMLPELKTLKGPKGNNKHKKPQSQLAARGQNQGNGKNKIAYAPKPKISPPPKRGKILLRTLSIINAGLRGSSTLKPGALSLYVGNGIILVSCLYDDGYVNHFMDNSIQVSRNNMVYFIAGPRDGIFEIDSSDSYTNVSSIYALSNKRAKSNLDSALLWHCRLGHISKKRIEKLQHDGLLNSTDLTAFEKYVPCMSGKMARKPYSHQVERAKDLLGLTHADVCGPFKIVSRQIASYFVTFTDDFSRYSYVYLLKHKHEVFETFKVFRKEVENQLDKTIKSLRSDPGGEYVSQEFLDHLKDHEIISHRTSPYMPQHNGVTDRRNITLLDMVRSMMSQTTLPKSFWDYALETVVRILNMVPTKKFEKTPYEVWHGQAPKLSYLKVWGCEALVKRDTLTKPDKLKPRSIKCIFVGYPKETMGYSFYYAPENKVLIARNAKFLENSTSLHHKKDDLEIDEPQSDIIPVRRSTRTRHAPDCMCLYIDAEDHEDLVELPPNGKTVGSKWLFKKKTDMDRDIRAIRILIAIAAFYDYEIWQMDVKTAFLNGYLSEKVYMEQPGGFINPKYPNRTEYVFVLNGGVVDWKSAKQNIFATLSVEADYIAAFDASKEAIRVKKFISRLGVVPTIEEPISMYCDNTEAITIANKSGITKGARHLRTKVHYLREVIEYGDVKLEKVHTDDNLANPFTKALAFPKHSEHTKNIEMLLASSLM
nr:hypothetical protein [Tanacetum cinerariifolium]